MSGESLRFLKRVAWVCGVSIIMAWESHRKGTIVGTRSTCADQTSQTSLSWTLLRRSIQSCRRNHKCDECMERIPQQPDCARGQWRADVSIRHTEAGGIQDRTEGNPEPHKRHEKSRAASTSSNTDACAWFLPMHLVCANRTCWCVFVCSCKSGRSIWMAFLLTHFQQITTIR